jgi:hypothetical protein
MGVVSGLNEQGLSLSTNYITGWPKGGGIPQMMLYRKIMEESRTPAEAVALLNGAKRSGANVMLIASDQGGLVCEYTRDRVAVRRADKGLVWATNHFRAIRKPSDCERYQHIEAAIPGEKGRVDLSWMQNILKDTALQRLNCQAMVFEPGTRSVHVAMTDTNPAAAGPYRTLTAEDLFDVPPAELENGGRDSAPPRESAVSTP